jgi:hypothetical protein
MWTKKEINIGKKKFTCQINSSGGVYELEIPYFDDWNGINEIVIEGRKYTVLSCENPGDRDEILNLIIREEKVKSDERKSDKSRKNPDDSK